MPVNIVPVQDKKQLDAFLQVPYRIYQDDPHYVSHLLDEMKKFFDKQ